MMPLRPSWDLLRSLLAIHRQHAGLAECGVWGIWGMGLRLKEKLYAPAELVALCMVRRAYDG